MMDRLLRRADEIADRTFSGWKVPGLVYGVLLDGRLVHARGLGTLRVGEDAPPSPDSAFRIASMTKSFTAATVLRLRDDRQLRLDDLAEQWVPELARLHYPTADSPRITIRHLLTMTAGLPTDDPWGDRQQGLDLDAFSDLLRGGLSFAWAPGTHFEYSNLGYGILGRVVTNVAGREYREVVRERLLEPLGMSATGYLAEEVPSERLAHGYVWRDDGFVEDPIDGYGALAAMGGVFTTLTDLARWVAGFQAAWPPRDDPEDGHPLSRAVRREMQQPQVSASLRLGQLSADAPPEVEAIGYGYGLFTHDDLRLGRIVGHGGGYPGFGSHMRWHPASGLGVIGMANGRYAPVSLLARDILAELVAADAAPRRRVIPATPTSEARAAVERLLERWDADLAAELLAMNVELDEPLERRRLAVQRLRDVHGRLRRDDSLPWRSDSPFHLEWWLAGDRGRVRAEIVLTPELPPRVQALNLTSVPDPAPELLAAAERLVAILAAAVDGAPRLPQDLQLGPNVDPGAVARSLRAAATRYGASTLGPAIDGDGTTRVTFRLASARGALDLGLERDPETGRLTSVSLVPPKVNALDLE